MVLAAILSVQVGASFAKSLFGEVTPVAMTWLRACSAAVVLALFRPRFVGLTRRDWASGLALAACLLGMNWAIYESFARIPIGLAVTIEFIGPLAVALLACRQWKDVTWVVLAALGVALLGFGPTTLNWPGVLLGLVAAACWAGYIVLGSRLSAAWRGVSVLFVTYVGGSVLLAAPAIATSGAALLDWRVIGLGVAVGLLSSVLPYSLELRALKVIPRRTFGVLMSLEPAAAALAALVLLREVLGALEWVAIGCVVVAAIGATYSARIAPPAASVQL